MVPVGYGVDLTELVLHGIIDPVEGRDDEIERCILILYEKTKNNPIIIGQAGAGKTAIAQGILIYMLEVKPILQVVIAADKNILSSKTVIFKYIQLSFVYGLSTCMKFDIQIRGRYLEKLASLKSENMQNKRWLLNEYEEISWLGYEIQSSSRSWSCNIPRKNGRLAAKM
ncbi:hypothetical protein OROMI_018838 [Orobanche minor]